MSVLNHLNTQLNSLLEMEELYLESSESIEILIEKSFSAVERIIRFQFYYLLRAEY